MDLPFPTHTRERNSQHKNKVNQKVKASKKYKRIQTYLQTQKLKRKGKKRHTNRVEYDYT